ncbi:MAG: beta-lactamase family protein [Fimbriimonadaceae bacterium]|nr:beta-lactamase family protein [Fimbriimonadaceae bacterium]
MVISLLAVALADPSPAVNTYFEDFLKQSRIPGIAVQYDVDGDITVLTKGIADIEKKNAITADMIFDSGSIGKMFTTVVTLKLVEQGKLKLTDTLGKYVKQVPEEWKSATVQNLLSHTSGLPEYVLYPRIGLIDSFDMKTWYEVMSDKPLDFKPGSEFQYSNSNFFMLKVIDESASGKKFDDLLKSSVFTPAKMTETGPLLTSKDDARKPTGYWITQEVQPIGPAGDSPDKGSGGHFTTVSDLSKFSHALFGGKLLNAESMKLMTTPMALPKGRKSGYGLGLFIRKVNGVEIWSHGGNSVGYAGSVTYIPSKKTTITLLGNAYQMTGDSVALGLARVLYPELNPKKYEPETDPDKEFSEKLIGVIKSLAARKIDDPMMSEEMQMRLARPRGQMQVGGYAPFATAEYDAFMGSEPADPDKIIRLRVKVGERLYLASFTVDTEGKVFTVGISPL